LHGLPYDVCVTHEEVLIPFGICSTGYYWNWFAVCEVVLPVVEVDEEAEVVPGEDTGHARAYFMGIDHLNVLVVGLAVDV